MKMSVFNMLLIILAYNASADECPILPSNNIWNTKLDKMPIHQKSSSYINTIGADLSLRYDFGAGEWNNAPIGIPYVLVDGSQEKTMVTFEYADESDNVPYPIPPNPPIEGGYESTGDRHIIIIDTSNCILYELYSAYQNEDGSWRAGSGSVFDLNSNELRTDTWTSADAAGLPIYPGLVRYEEVAAGEINHLIRFTVPKTQRAYLWPARHYASSITDVNYPPMGIVMRLKSTVNIDDYTPQAKVIAQALKSYGMILADNGSAWYMSGVPDERWDNDDLYALRKNLKGSDFEAIDISELQLSANSGEAKQEATSVEKNIEISIYPNPTQHYIRLNNYIGNITIVNSIGVELWKGNVSNNQKIDISEYENGIYFIKSKDMFSKFIVLK